MNIKAWQEGRAAFRAGRAFKDNPYQSDGDVHDWATGFMEAEAMDSACRKSREWNGVKGGAGHGRCDKYINPLTSK